MIFISYSNADKLVARRYAAALSWRGNRVWFDENSLRVGDPLLAELDTIVARSSLLVVLVSRASLKSPCVRAELHSARTHGIRIAPLLVEDVAKDLPDDLASLVRVDFGTGIAEAVDRIVGLDYSQSDAGRRDVWLQIDDAGVLRHPVNLMSVSDEIESIHILDSDFHNVVKEALAVLPLDLTFMPQSERGHWTHRVDGFSEQVRFLVDEMKQALKALEISSTADAEFSRSFAYEYCRAVVMRVLRFCERVQYYHDPYPVSEEEAIELNRMPESGLFLGGLRIQLIWGHRVVTAEAPAYIEEIDVRGRPYPVKGLMCPRDVGAILGFGLGLQSWGLSLSTPKQSMWGAGLPSMETLTVGLA